MHSHHLVRVATELNLHLPVATIPQDEKPAREILNRARVWINCFNLDRSTGGQYGKPPIINSMDYQANHSQNWWKSSPFNMRNFDIQICCYNHCLRTTASFVAKIYNDPENPTGLNQVRLNLTRYFEADDRIERWVWETRSGDGRPTSITPSTVVCGYSGEHRSGRHSEQVPDAITPASI
jgi:hypothetical protein